MKSELGYNDCTLIKEVAVTFVICRHSPGDLVPYIFVQTRLEAIKWK